MSNTNSIFAVNAQDAGRTTTIEHVAAVLSDYFKMAATKSDADAYDWSTQDRWVFLEPNQQWPEPEQEDEPDLNHYQYQVTIRDHKDPPTDSKLVSDLARKTFEYLKATREFEILLTYNVETEEDYFNPHDASPS
jgi:hypothetical protein